MHALGHASKILLLFDYLGSLLRVLPCGLGLRLLPLLRLSHRHSCQKTFVFAPFGAPLSARDVYNANLLPRSSDCSQYFFKNLNFLYFFHDVGKNGGLPTSYALLIHVFSPLVPLFYTFEPWCIIPHSASIISQNRCLLRSVTPYISTD